MLNLSDTPSLSTTLLIVSPLCLPLILWLTLKALEVLALKLSSDL